MGLRDLVRWLVCGGVLASVSSHALTIVSGPTITHATNAPLAGLLELTTDDYSRVSVVVADGNSTWQRTFYDYDTAHSVPLLGFKAGRTNDITITVTDRFGHAVTAQTVRFVTSPLPNNFPKISALVSVPEKMEPGYTLFRDLNRNSNAAYVIFADNTGQVAWYSGVQTSADIRQMENGDLFIPLATNFIEVDMLGRIVNNWVAPGNLPLNNH